MSTHKLYATIVADPSEEAYYCSDISITPGIRVFLYHVDLWGVVEYHFPSREKENQWIVRIRTDDGQRTKHVGIRLNPGVVYARYDNEDES